jgi:N-dimethylarginine dimethylaminohydrolase
MAAAAFLMCRPTFYGIEYEINPWMDVRRQADRRLAIRQWLELRRVLEEEIKARVLTIRARPGLPDMCFAANAGLVRGNTFIPGRFRHQERAGEEPFFRGWFRRRGYRIAALPEDYRFEGGGDALFVGKNLFAGYYFRSDVQTHAFLGISLGRRVFSLALTDRRFYHLDTCFSPIGPSAAIYYPGAFDRYSLSVLRRNVKDLLQVTPEEALQFACNAIVVGKKAVISKPCCRLARELEGRGFTVYRLDFSEFMKAGGAARCLTLSLPARRTRP